MDEKLPDGWVWTTLGEIRLDLAKGIVPNQFPSQVFELYSVPNFDIGMPEIVQGKSIGSNKQVVEIGTVLLCKINPRINRSWIVDNFSEYLKIASTEWIPFFKVKNILPEYLCYFFRLKHFKDFIASNASGVGGSLMRINPQTIADYPFSLAPTNEQSRIVSVIEQQFTRLDSAVASLQSAKARSKQYRASLLKSAVEGELTKEWRAEHPASETGEQLLVRILQERHARWEEEQLAKMHEKGIVPRDEKWKEKYEEPERPDVENLPELPEGWCWTTLESIAYIQLGKMLSPKAYEQGLLQLPYLRNENIRWASIDYNDIKKMGFKESELEKYSLLPNDLLVCEGGEPGRCAVYKANNEYLSKDKYLMYQKALHRVRMIENIISPYFIQFCLQYYAESQTIIPKFSETTIKHLPLEKISILPIPLPPFAEQEQIIAEVEARLSTIEQMEVTIEANLKRAERDRQSILQEAFAGRLVPQDPNDEPASILLERIREERTKREEEEKIVKISRKGIQMEAAKKRQARKVLGREAGVGLYEVLVAEGEPLQPQEVFRKVGLKTEEQPESVETFYEELRSDVADGLIGVIRPDIAMVLLEALDVPVEEVEVLEPVEEEIEVVELVQEEDEKLSPEWPTLWDELDNA